MALLQKLCLLGKPCSVSSLEKKRKDALALDVELEQFLYHKALDLLNSHADCLGIPNKFLLVPLLTTISALINPGSEIRVDEWYREPPILWTMLVARPGEKKSVAFNYLLNAIHEAETNIITSRTDNDQDSNADIPQLTVVNCSFSVAKLMERMVRSENKCYLMYDEMFKFFDSLSTVSGSGDRTIFLSLYDGGESQRSTIRHGTSIMRQTQVNMCGFIQALPVAALIAQKDIDGLLDRFLLFMPKRRKVYLNERIALPQGTKSLTAILIQIHDVAASRPITFTLATGAYEKFREFYDTVQDLNDVEESDPIRGHTAKAPSQVMRMALALHLFYYAVDCGNDARATQRLSTEVQSATIEHAVQCVKISLQQKLAMTTKDYEEDGIGSDVEETTHSSLLPSYKDILKTSDSEFVRKLLEDDKIIIIEPSIVANRKRMPILPKRFRLRHRNVPRPVAAAVAYISSLVEIGILKEVQQRGQVRRFIRCPWNTMIPEISSLLEEKIGVKKAVYDQLCEKANDQITPEGDA